MNPTTTYILEQLTENTVNIVFITSISLNDKIYELERNRICFGNSPIGRQQVVDTLPEQYAKAIFDIWGETATLEDPQAPEDI